MENNLNLRSEKTRSLIGRIPYDFSLKGALLAILLILASIASLSVIKVPSYLDCPLHVSGGAPSGEIRGVVILPAEDLSAGYEKTIRVFRGDARQYVEGEITDVSVFGKIAVLNVELSQGDLALDSLTTRIQVGSNPVIDYLRFPNANSE